MLENRSIAVLNSLNRLSQINEYKVVTIEDILDNIKKNYQFDQSDIQKCMEFLDKQGFINIKYSDKNTFCYCLLPKSKMILEETKEKMSKSKTNNFYSLLLIMLASFIGSMSALLIFYYLI